mgnify:CR=1 FL=1
MVSNKMIFGALLTLIGLTFSGFSFIYAALNPWNIDGTEGLLVSLMGTNMWLLLLVAMIIMISGLAICFKEAYPNTKIWGNIE